MEIKKSGMMSIVGRPNVGSLVLYRHIQFAVLQIRHGYI